MPKTASAKRALKISLRNRKFNLFHLKRIKKIKREIKKALKKGAPKDAEKLLNLFYKYVDKATKRKVFHKNKGSRLKSKLTKLVLKSKIEKESKKISRPKNK